MTKIRGSRILFLAAQSDYPRLVHANQGKEVRSVANCSSPLPEHALAPWRGTLTMNGTARLSSHNTRSRGKFLQQCSYFGTSVADPWTVMRPKHYARPGEGTQRQCSLSLPPSLSSLFLSCLERHDVPDGQVQRNRPPRHFLRGEIVSPVDANLVGPPRREPGQRELPQHQPLSLRRAGGESISLFPLLRDSSDRATHGRCCVRRIQNVRQAVRCVTLPSSTPKRGKNNGGGRIAESVVLFSDVFHSFRGLTANRTTGGRTVVQHAHGVGTLGRE